MPCFHIRLGLIRSLPFRRYTIFRPSCNRSVTSCHPLSLSLQGSLLSWYNQHHRYKHILLCLLQMYHDLCVVCSLRCCCLPFWACSAWCMQVLRRILRAEQLFPLLFPRTSLSAGNRNIGVPQSGQSSGGISTPQSYFCISPQMIFLQFGQR